MKYLFTFLFVGLIISFVFAHSGGTDSRGGHYDNDEGEYHYHHGESAHKHYEGHCPHDADDDLWVICGLEAISIFSFLKIRDKIKGK